MLVSDMPTPPYSTLISKKVRWDSFFYTFQKNFEDLIFLLPFLLSLFSSCPGSISGLNDVMSTLSGIVNSRAWRVYSVYRMTPRPAPWAEWSSSSFSSSGFSSVLPVLSSVSTLLLPSFCYSNLDLSFPWPSVKMLNSLVEHQIRKRTFFSLHGYSIFLFRLMGKINLWIRLISTGHGRGIKIFDKTNR